MFGNRKLKNVVMELEETNLDLDAALTIAKRDIDGMARDIASLERRTRDHERAMQIKVPAHNGDTIAVSVGELLALLVANLRIEVGKIPIRDEELYMVQRPLETPEVERANSEGREVKP